MLDSLVLRTNSATVRLLAPAKLNLHLRVGPPRADGFHPLLSWMCTAGLFDKLTLEPKKADTSHAALIDLTCDWADLPCDQRNLVVRVTSSWAETCRQQNAGREIRPLRARLQKNIPMGAGLGGGSSDGAKALLGANELWRTGGSRQQLAEFAAQFGSDLPFFFFGPNSVCRSRGEVVEPIARPTPRWAMLVLPEIQMPTPDVYRRFDAMSLGRLQDVQQEPQWNQWSKLGASELLRHLVNDLEAPAFAIAPQLGELREAIERELGRPVRMSGSGSSLFTLFDEEQEAREAKEKIAQVQLPKVKFVVAALAPDVVDDLSNA